MSPRLSRTALGLCLLMLAVSPALAAREGRGGARGGQAAEKAHKTAPEKAAADKLPQNLKDLVAKQIPGSKVLDFEEQTEETRHLFFIDVQNGDKKETLLCSGRAQYLGILDPADDPNDDDDATYLDPATAPDAVRVALSKHLGKTPVASLSFEVDKERFFYIAEYEQAGKTHFATFTLQGDLTEEETDLPVADLPAAVRASVLAAHPHATLDSASTLQIKKATTYAVDITDDQKHLELILAPDGAIHSTDTLDDEPDTRPAK
jgi:hypothetical protein